MFHLWELLCMSVCELKVCVLERTCVCVCVCPSLAWLASSRLERMDHTDAWQCSTTAWLPLSHRLLLSFFELPHQHKLFSFPLISPPIVYSVLPHFHLKQTPKADGHLAITYSQRFSSQVALFQPQIAT